MYLFILTDEFPDWDEYDGFAIYAENEADARQMAQARDRDNTKYGSRQCKWLNPEVTSCECQPVAVATTVPAGIALSGFHAG